MHSISKHKKYRTVLFLIATFVSAVTTSPVYAEVTEVDNTQLQALIEKGIPIIDVRRPDEWKRTGIVEGSHLMTFFDAKGRYNIEAWVTELNKIVEKDEHFVLICAVGGRTGSISKLLDLKLGYTGVHNVSKGINHWIRKGEKTVSWSP